MKVLVWGTAIQGACAYFRGHMFDEPLKELGVELKHISKLDFKTVDGFEGTYEEALKAGALELDRETIEWADVVMFRRYYNTAFKCGSYVDVNHPGCGFLSTDPAEAGAHAHGFKEQDSISRYIWPAFRDSWTGGIVYETDDDHWSIKPWNGYYPDVRAERDLIEDMTRRADIVTVATPQLAVAYGRYNKNIRVIRNAIDPDLYQRDTPRPEGDKPRLVYYGSTARLRDYGGRLVTGNPADGKGYAMQAVEEHRNELTRVFLGTNEGSAHVVGELFDEQTPYIENIPAFSKALANSHGDIGIAPLGGDDFDKAKSELHWLEYAITGMAFIGERYNGHGPYEVVRHGVDGLLARGAQEWHDSVRALARSRDLREQLAGAARERVLAEYDYRQRAHEWADAFRYAAEHARGALASVAA